MPFEELSHTGDLQYRITARSREELFAEAAHALFATITDPGTIEEREMRCITAQGSTLEELLLEFLRGCFQEFTKDEFVAKRCSVSSLTEDTDFLIFRICASIRGERFNEKKHPFRTEIKAVTYHGASVRKLEGKPAPRSSAQQSEVGWEAVFTLDL